MNTLQHWSLSILGVLILAFVSSGCGSSYIILEIGLSSDAQVQIDQLQLTTLDADNLSRVLSDVNLSIKAGQEFPVEVLLEPSDDTPPRLRERAVGTLGGTTLVQKEVEHGWKPHRINRARFDLQAAH